MWRAFLPPCDVLSTPNLRKCNRRCICRRSGALPESLEKKGGCGRRDIQRLDFAVLRKSDEAVAAGGHAGAEALALAAQDDHGGAGEIHSPGGLLGLGVGAPDPEACL